MRYFLQTSWKADIDELLFILSPGTSRCR